MAEEQAEKSVEKPAERPAPPPAAKPKPAGVPKPQQPQPKQGGFLGGKKDRRKKVKRLYDGPEEQGPDYSKPILKVTFFEQLDVEVQELIGMAKRFKKSMLDSIVFKFRKREGLELLTGSRMGLDHQKALMLMKKLQANPLDIAARTALVDDFVRYDKTATADTLWEVMKNALFSVSLDDISVQAINNAIAVQQLWFKAVMPPMLSEAESIEAKIRDEDTKVADGEGSKERQASQNHVLKQLLRQRNARLETVKYLNTIRGVLKGIPGDKEVKINLKEFLLSQAGTPDQQDSGSAAGAAQPGKPEKPTKTLGGGKGQKKGPEYNFNEIVKTIVYLPAIYKRASDLCDSVNKAFPKRPTGYIYKTRLNKVNAKVIDAAMIKEKKIAHEDVKFSELQKRRNTYMNQALAIISQGCKAVPEVPRDKVDNTALKEYGVVIIEIHQYFPEFNIVKHATHCSRLLMRIADDPQAVEIQGILNSLLEKGGRYVPKNEEGGAGDE